MKLSDGKNYLKTDAVKSGDVIHIKNEGEWVDSRKFTYEDGSPRKDFIIKVSLNEQDFDMRLNATNRKALIAGFGDETERWIGKIAKIEIVNVMVSGKMMKTILLTPVCDPKDVQYEE